ncbi:MAG: hypothetical protein II723_04335 [Oscillospiraceae bacterium]|nr:hypothetical protein [Oscillospiraceae bacterium]
MKDYQFAASGKTVHFSADASKDTAELFRQLMTDQERRYRIITDGKRIQILSLFFIVRAEGRDFRIFAPDYAGNPAEDMISDLTLSLQLLGKQLFIMQKTGLSPQDSVSVLDTVLVRRSALQSPDVYLMKQEKKEKADSGLYLGSVSDRTKTGNPEDYTVMQIYQLLHTHPTALAAVCLPVGSIAVIRNNEIAGICDPSGKEVFREEAPEN